MLPAVLHQTLLQGQYLLRSDGIAGTTRGVPVLTKKAVSSNMQIVAGSVLNVTLDKWNFFLSICVRYDKSYLLCFFLSLSTIECKLFVDNLKTVFMNSKRHFNEGKMVNWQTIRCRDTAIPYRISTNESGSFEAINAIIKVQTPLLNIHLLLILLKITTLFYS